MKITILSENSVPTSFGLLAEHGWCVYIEKNEKSYLLDTGQNGIAVHNADILRIDLQNVETIFLSHGHYDHCNGLEAVLQRINKPVEVISHSMIFEKKYLSGNQEQKYIGIKYSKDYLENYLKAQFRFENQFFNAGNDIYLTGEVPLDNQIEKIPDSLTVQQYGYNKKDWFSDDNSLVIDTPKGLVIVLGCAHRGVVNISNYAKKQLGKNIYGIIGGMHLNDASDKHFQFVLDFLKEEKVQLLAPAHCTGLEKIFEMKRCFPEAVKPAFCGTVFEFEGN